MLDLQSAAAQLRRLLHGEHGFGSVCHLQSEHVPVFNELLSELLQQRPVQEPWPASAGSSLLQYAESHQKASVSMSGPLDGNSSRVVAPARFVGLLFTHCSSPGSTTAEPPSLNSRLALAVFSGYCTLVAFNLFFGLYQHSDVLGASSSKGRCKIWDATKFALMTGVIFFHCAFYLSAEDLTSWTLSRAILRPVVPCFIFVSGVFGSNVSMNALWKAVFYPWPCVVVILAVFAIHFSGLMRITGFNGFAFWYLWCLSFWRLTVSPVIYLGNAMLGLPIILLLLPLQLGAYVLLNTMGSDGGLWKDVWHCYLFYAPIFAAGMLATPNFWKETFAESKRATGAVLASVGFLVLWYYMFFASADFSKWNTAYCKDEETCKMGNYGVPNDVLHEPITEESLGENLVTFMLRLGIILAYLGALASILHGLEAVWPELVSLLAGWGERSLYAYVLHHIWLELIIVVGGKTMLDVVPPGWRPGFCFFVAFQFTIVLSSQGTERLARWALIPPWV